MKKELSERERRVFAETPEMQAVLTLAVPTVLSQIITVIYNLADTYFIGRTICDPSVCPECDPLRADNKRNGDCYL